jgi:hypothetical protein
MTDEINGAQTAEDEVLPDDTVTPEVEAPVPSRREAIDKAFASLSDDNGPVERVRDDQGRFVRKDGAEQPAAEKPASEPAKPVETPAQEAAKPATDIEPPSRFAPEAKAAWQATPEPVRKEVQRAINELTSGIEKYREAGEAYRNIEHFDRMARETGTTLVDALNNYVGIETMLRQDPIKGFATIAQNIGLNPAEIGAALAGQQHQPGAADQTIHSLKQEVLALKQQLGTVTGTIQQQRQQTTLQQVEAFAKANPHFDVVQETIAQMLETGFAKSLQDAYEKAIRLSPEVQAAIAAETAAKAAPPAPPPHTQKARLSITGSPATASNASATPPGSRQDAINRAFAAVGIN